MTALVIFVVILLLILAVAGVVLALVLRKGTQAIGRDVAAAGLAQAEQVTSGQADPVQQHAGELAQLGGMAGAFGVHLDLADDLGVKVPGTGMQQLTRGTLHVVGRSAPDARSMRAPCTIAYAIEAPGVPAFSGEQVFEVSTNQWPEPGDTLPCVYDAADPTKVDIDWSQLPTSGDKALGDAQALADELNGEGPVMMGLGTGFVIIMVLSVATPLIVIALVFWLVKTAMGRVSGGIPGLLGQPPGSGMSQPTQGTMHVTGASTPVRGAMIANCQLSYAIESPGIPAFSGQQQFFAHSNRWPYPGMSMPVVFDAANPGHVDIEWNLIPTSSDIGAAQAQALAQQLNSGQPPAPGATA